MAALDRAVALEQMHDVAVTVAEHLHLDMARRGQVPFEQHPVVAEGAGGLAARAIERTLKFGGVAGRCACRARRRRPTP